MKDSRAHILKDSKNTLRICKTRRSLSLRVIQDQSMSNSERGKDKYLYLTEEAGLTPLLGITQLIGWLVGWFYLKFDMTGYCSTKPKVQGFFICHIIVIQGIIRSEM